MVQNKFNHFNVKNLIEVCTNSETLDKYQSEIYSANFLNLSTDSRDDLHNKVFIAIKGEIFDGNDFIDQALKAGAVFAIGEVEPDSIEDKSRYLKVEDAILAFGLFAKFHKSQCSAQGQLLVTIAITGSNGKTSTTQWLQNIWRKILPPEEVLVTLGNFNNNLGLPKTLLNLNYQHRCLILEMGANHQNEISYLVHLAQPQIIAITNAGLAHLQGFGSIANIAAAKGEILDNLGESSFAILNQDDAFFNYWENKVNPTKTKIISFGFKNSSDIKISNLAQNNFDLEFNFEYQTEQVTIKLDKAIKHNAVNAATVTALSLAMFETFLASATLSNNGLSANKKSISFPEICQLMADSLPKVKGRLNFYQFANSQSYFIDDSYNANLDSVKNAITTLSTLAGKKILILGGLAEVGDMKQKHYQAIAKSAMVNKIDSIWALADQDLKTDLLDVFHKQSGKEALFFVDFAAIHSYILKLIKDKLDKKTTINILIKGSRSAQMDRLFEVVNDNFSLSPQ